MIDGLLILSLCCLGVGILGIFEKIFEFILEFLYYYIQIKGVKNNDKINNRTGS